MQWKPFFLKCCEQIIRIMATKVRRTCRRDIDRYAKEQKKKKHVCVIITIFVFFFLFSFKTIPLVIVAGCRRVFCNGISRVPSALYFRLDFSSAWHFRLPATGLPFIRGPRPSLRYRIFSSCGAQYRRFINYRHYCCQTLSPVSGTAALPLHDCVPP